METFAGFLAHTDAQIARVIDSLEDMGISDNTLVIYITGDNGASAEGTIHGAWSAPSFQNGVPEDPEWLLDHMDDFGTDKCENHFNVGWAWALDSPFQWMKQVASHFGGTRNAMALSWPKKIADKGGLRTQFHHVIDIVPTIYDIVGIAPPTHVNGIEQMPLHGTSMAYSFNAADAPSTHTSQYFEILGNRAIYADGWMASCFHGSDCRVLSLMDHKKCGSCTTLPKTSRKQSILLRNTQKNLPNCKPSFISMQLITVSTHFATLVHRVTEISRCHTHSTA
jgi:arylsulfatase